MTTPTSNRAGHRTIRKPVITGSSKEQLSLLRDAPKLVRAMYARGLVRFPAVPTRGGDK